MPGVIHKVLLICADISKEHKKETVMNSPWQVGLLALAVTGVSTYDYMFIKNRNVVKQPAIEIQSPQPVSGSGAPLLAPLPEPAISEKAMDATDGDLRPAISLDELHSLSKQAFIIKEDSESGSVVSQPKRAPVTRQLLVEKTERNIPLMSEINQPPIPMPLPAPQCVFSGTLIEGGIKLALVNGMPLTIGDRLGIWQLARIESDYIVLESGTKTHRVELKSGENQSALRKDPS